MHIHHAYDIGDRYVVFGSESSMGLFWRKDSDEGKEVSAYLASYPKALVPKPVPPLPSAQELKARRIAEIKAAILALDAATIRPLRAGETARVDEIEAQIVVLRVELHTLV